jgi:hypothetical protein
VAAVLQLSKAGANESGEFRPDDGLKVGRREAQSRKSRSVSSTREKKGGGAKPATFL